MSVSKMSQIDKALHKVQRRTKADIAQKLGAGLPIATFDGSSMELHQIISEPQPEFVTHNVKPRTGRAQLAQLSASQMKEFVARQAQEDEEPRFTHS